MPTVSIAPGSTPTQIAGKTDRRYLFIQNLSDTDIYIGLDDPSVTVEDGANSGIRLKANGGNIPFPEIGGERSMNNFAVYGVHADVSAKNIRITELS